MAFIGLDVHLSDNDRSLLDAGAAWTESAHGKATLRTWAEGSGEAHINDGTPVETANDMAG